MDADFAVATPRLRQKVLAPSEPRIQHGRIRYRSSTKSSKNSIVKGVERTQVALTNIKARTPGPLFFYSSLAAALVRPCIESMSRAQYGITVGSPGVRRVDTNWPQERV